MKISKFVFADILLLVVYFVYLKKSNIIADSEFVSLFIMVNTLSMSYLLQCKQTEEEHKRDVVKYMPYLRCVGCKIKNGRKGVLKDGQKVKYYSAISFLIENAGEGICKNIEIVYVDYRDSYENPYNAIEFEKMLWNMYPISKKIITKNDNFKFTLNVKNRFVKDKNRYFKITFKFEDIYKNIYYQSINLCVDDGYKYANATFPSTNLNNCKLKIDDAEEILLKEFFEIPMVEELDEKE